MVGSEKVEKVIQAPKELPTEWQNATLVEVAEIIMGQSPPSQYYNSDGEGLPFFQGKAEFGSLYPEAIKWCTEPTKVAERDDVLISVRAPVGPTNLAPSKCCIGRGLAAIRPRDGVPSRYVLYYLRSIESGIDALGTGTTFKAISGGVLRSIPISVAPVAQQYRIVAEIEKQFSRLDEAVANLKRVKANLKRYKAAVLKAAVEGKLTEDWRKHHPDVEPASKLLERILAERREKWNGRGKYKEPAGPNSKLIQTLPKGWVLATAEQCTSVITDGEHITPQRSTSGVLLLSARNILDGRLSLSDVDYVPRSEYDRIAKRLVINPGDVLLSCSGTVGRSTVAPEKLMFTLVRSVAVLKPLAEMGKYLSIALRSPGLQEQVSEKKTQTAQSNIFQGKLKTLVFPLPPLTEQQGIVAEVERRLSVIEELEAGVEANLTRAERLRQSVLTSAFSGRLVDRNKTTANSDRQIDVY